MPDAVVVGSGPNGLVAANMLADAGWSVQVFEAQPEPGGAVRSDRGVDPAFTNDLFSSFYPLALASPAIQGLGLGEYGLSWSHAPTVLAHPLPDGRCVTLHRNAADTAASLADMFGTADGQAWLRLSELWDELSPQLLQTLFSPFPPVRAAAALGRRLRSSGALRTMRFLTLPARRLAEEEFAGPGAGLLLTGCALHTDMLPEAPGSAALGWLMTMLGQQFGWPAAAGGASSLPAALVRRLEARGGTVTCGMRVEEVIVRDGRALGVRTADGERHRATRAVIADVSAPALYGRLVTWDALPSSLRADMRRFQWDPATVKVDWALSEPIPWTSAGTTDAGTVHVGTDLNELSDYSHDVATGRLPDKPFLLVGQMTTADPSRSPRGTEAAWAYTHVPQTITEDRGGDDITGTWDERETTAIASRLEQQMERFAPGFRDLVIARRILTPPRLESLNENLVGGAIDGGTASVHQQLFFRPVPGTGRPETAIAKLYLASASAHPGGGVHGVCGANAARAALSAHGLLGNRIKTPGLAAVQHLITEPPRSGKRNGPTGR